MKRAGFVFCFCFIILFASLCSLFAASAVDSLVGEWRAAWTSSSGQRGHDSSAGSVYSTLTIRPGEKEGTISGECSPYADKFANVPVVNGKFSWHGDSSGRDFKFTLRSDGTLSGEAIGGTSFTAVFKKAK